MTDIYHEDQPDFSRLNHRHLELLEVIKGWSMETACKATTRTMARFFCYHESTIYVWLRELKKAGLICSNNAKIPLRGRGWTTLRTIYVVSYLRAAQGALLVANLVRRAGDARCWELDEIAGQLLCNIGQAMDWIARAEKEGWLRAWVDNAGKRHFRLLAEFPRVPLPHDGRQLPQRPQRELHRTKRELLNLVKAHGQLRWTDERLMDHLDVRARRLRQVLEELSEAGVLFSARDNVGRILSRTPIEPQGPALSPVDVRILDYVFDNPFTGDNLMLCVVVRCEEVTAKRRVKKLADMGLLTVDGRGASRILTITEAGQDALQRHRAAREALDDGPVSRAARVSPRGTPRVLILDA